MLSDDVYRTKLSAAFAGIKRAADDLAGVAGVEARQDASGLRLALQPCIAGACPMELMVRADQRFDVEIGTEFYEDCEIGSLDDFENMIREIAAGNVITRHYFSAATGSLLSVETIVSFADGRQWRRGHRISALMDRADGDAILIKDRTFLPYSRRT